MKLSKSTARDSISINLERYGDLLSTRVSYLMEQLKLFENHESKEIDLFELLIRLIFLADEGPAESIANLMVPLDAEGFCLLDENTIPESASFLRDFLKKDYILYTLKNNAI